MPIPTPQNSVSPVKAVLAFLTFHAIGFLGSLIDAVAVRFLDWLLTRDWTALTECSQAWVSTGLPFP